MTYYVLRGTLNPTHSLIECAQISSNLVQTRLRDVVFDCPQADSTSKLSTVRCTHSAASLPFMILTYVDTSLTTVSALWSCRLFILHSTMATSSWSGILPISRDNFSQCSTLQLIWCTDFFVVIMLQMCLQLCTGCACQNA